MEQLAVAGREDAAGGEDRRVQFRLDVREGPTGEGDETDTRIAVVVDVETTGLDIDNGAVIELAMRRVRFDREGIVTHVDRPYQWLEDPGFPLDPQITEITKLVDGDLVGERIDEGEALRVLRSASLVIAHNARFDRPWIERRLKVVGGLDWACSMEQIDWRARGFEGRGLSYLLCQAGWFHDGHRALQDVDATIQLLRHRFDDGRTALSILTDRAARPSWLIRAVGADFYVKEVLKARGYRWDADRRVWWTEVVDECRTPEEFWLADNVYSIAASARSMGPVIEEMTASTRFL